MMGADYYETDEVQKDNAARGIPQIGVGSGCRINRAIIDKNTRIGERCVLSPDGISSALMLANFAPGPPAPRNPGRLNAAAQH